MENREEFARAITIALLSRPDYPIDVNNKAQIAHTANELYNEVLKALKPPANPNRKVAPVTNY
jgi:hypothetical protein